MTPLTRALLGLLRIVLFFASLYVVGTVGWYGDPNAWQMALVIITGIILML